MYMNEQLNETDKQQIIKIFMNDGYGALKENSDLKTKYGDEFVKNKDVKDLLKYARFNRYFDKRLEGTIYALNNLENMSNTNNYYFTRDEIKSRLKELDQVHRKLQNSFSAACDKLERQAKESTEGQEEHDPEELLKMYENAKNMNIKKGRK